MSETGVPTIAGKREVFITESVTRRLRAEDV